MGFQELGLVSSLEANLVCSLGQSRIVLGRHLAKRFGGQLNVVPCEDSSQLGVVYL